MAIKELYVFRHGETDWNREKRFQGHIDIPLNDVGRMQARELIPLLRERQIEAIISSDLSRANETASIVASGLGIQVFKDPGLREAFLGRAQGLTADEIQAQWAELSVRWRSDHVSDADISYPEGETPRQIIERAKQSLESFLSRNPFDRIGVSTHGGVIRRLIRSVFPSTGPGEGTIPIPNGVLYLLYYDTERTSFFSDRCQPINKTGGPS